MSNLKKIIAWISVFAISISLLSVPAFASSDFTYDQKVGFWSWTKNVPILSDLIGYSVGWVCAESDDGYHHANSCLYEAGDYYRCICFYCGKEFTAYESDIQQSYDNYVSELPATGYNSAGNLIWYPTFSDVSKYYIQVSNGGYSVETLPYANYGCEFDVDTSNNAVRGVYTSYSSGNQFYVTFSLIAPISGMYTIIKSSPRYYLYAYFTDGTFLEQTGDYSDHSLINSHKSKGAVFSIYVPEDRLSLSKKWTGYVNWFFPAYEIIPDSSLGSNSDAYYNVTTRPTTITGGNYGIVGDNGQITRIEDNSTIINETNNTYYNPATGQKETILDWSYNYTDRSYNITLESGDTVTVTYGDQNITIVEGDTNYTIYYIIDGSGSGSDPNPGVSSDPEPSTSPDPTPSTSPPGGSGNSDDDGKSIWDKLGEFFGTILGGIIGMIEAVIGKILDALIALGKMIMDKLTSVVEVVLSIFDEVPKLFGGFLDFLSAMFPYLPDEIMLLLTFGIAAVVFVWIIKAIRR